MADIVKTLPTKRFGIKEVADVHFYDVVDTVESLDEALSTYADKRPVISFDTLKVSNIESTAENSEARGGKGNAALISWDYGREVTVTLEDALMSMETLGLLFEDDVAGGNEGIITINANTFPGTYAIIGTTYARNEAGQDEVFKFVIPKAKIQSETTLTMEAEGDPTVIGMTLKVLRVRNGDMMGLVLETTDQATLYTASFRFANGESTTFRVSKGDTITAPGNTDGYEWNTTPVTTVNKSAAYYEVKKEA